VAKNKNSIKIKPVFNTQYLMPNKIINNQAYTLSDYCKKMVRYGYLIKVLSKRELKIKYSKTLLGLGWLILQPLVVVFVYSIFFNHIIKLNTDNIPYPAFVFSGLVLWYIFTGVVGKCTYALIESTELINKVSFPRLIILLSKVIPVLIECFILLIMLFIVLIISKQKMGFNSLTSLFYFTQITILSFSFGMLCSIIVIKYRDLAHIIPFAMNFGIWLTPVFYSVTIVPENYQNLLRYLNPLSLPLEGLRDGLFFNRGISNSSLVLLVFSIILLLLSFYFFVKFEKKIVENL
jgi:lipopolysaccharide transport system permease protein